MRSPHSLRSLLKYATRQFLLFTGVAMGWMAVGSFRAAAQGVLDQEQAVYTGGTSARTLPGYSISQSFTAGVSGQLTGIDMGFFGVMSGDGELQIFEGEGTAGMLLQSLPVQVIVPVATDFVWVHWDVNVPSVRGRQYTFNFIPDSATIPDPYGVAVAMSDVYAGGAMGFVDPSGTSVTDMDVCFRTYVSGAAAANVRIHEFAMESGGILTRKNGVGQIARIAQIGLTAPAPAGGITVTMASSNVAALRTPVSLFFPAGTQQVEFNLERGTVKKATSVKLTATLGRSHKSIAVKVLP